MSKRKSDVSVPPPVALKRSAKANLFSAPTPIEKKVTAPVVEELPSLGIVSLSELTYGKHYKLDFDATKGYRLVPQAKFQLLNTKQLGKFHQIKYGINPTHVTKNIVIRLYEEELKAVKRFYQDVQAAFELMTNQSTDKFYMNRLSFEELKINIVDEHHPIPIQQLSYVNPEEEPNLVEFVPMDVNELRWNDYICAQLNPSFYCRSPTQVGISFYLVTAQVFRVPNSEAQTTPFIQLDGVQYVQGVKKEEMEAEEVTTLEDFHP